jgi:hypothetical protein
MKRIIAILLVCSLVAGEALAVGRKKATYVGGTIESLNQRKKASEGELDLKSDQALIFKVEGQTITVAYDRISALEYQNTAKGRPAAVSGAIGAAYGTLMLASMATLFLLPVAMATIPFAKKKRKCHFLTIAYKDEDDKPQAMVLELGKNIEREARAVISARSGKEVRVIIEPD